MVRRYDRTGEPIEVLPDFVPTPRPTPHDPACADGWLGETDDDVVRPCPSCRPRAAGQRQRLRSLLDGTPS